MALTAQGKTPSKGRYESRRALAVSIALHIVLGVGLIRVLLMPGGLRNWLGLGDNAKPHAEHIRYVAVPPSSAPAPSGSQAAKTPTAPPPPATRTIVAPPTSVPTTLPPVPTTKPSAPAEVDGVGPVAATGGPATGARPEYHGPQVWIPAAPPGTGQRPSTLSERLDSSAHAIVGHVNDSLAMGGPTKKPGDWTKEIGGKKYGIDPQFIHIGPISIPTAVLAALPLNNFTGNPIASANERLLNSRRDDIMFQATRAMNDEEFHKAVKEERLRNERAHEQQQKQKKEQQDQQQNAPPPTVAKTGSQ